MLFGSTNLKNCAQQSIVRNSGGQLYSQHNFAFIWFNFKFCVPLLHQHRADTAPNSQTAAMLPLAASKSADEVKNRK
jgi:hypothetical protein